MVFEYTPTSDTLVESFWSFSIPSQGLVVPFLLMGHVTEPRVTLDRPAINFGRVGPQQTHDGLLSHTLARIAIDDMSASGVH
jgi:hypothetical protein